jgi:NDP-sugar pyrophosphorylase family protein
MTRYSDITAVILAGGLGTRLRGVVCDKPKVLAEVNNRPFIQYLLDQLSASGIRRTVLCTGYLGDQIEKTFGAGYEQMRLAYSREPEPLGTGGALRLALPLLETEQVMVLNGDSYCSLDHTIFFDFHAEKLASMSLCLTEVADVSRYGAVQVDRDGRILKFEEKGVRSGAGAINAGIYLIGRPLIEAIPPKAAVSLEKDVIPTAISAGLFGFNSGGRFIDIGIPSDYEAAQHFFTRH